MTDCGWIQIGCFIAGGVVVGVAVTLWLLSKTKPRLPW